MVAKSRNSKRRKEKRKPMFSKYQSKFPTGSTASPKFPQHLNVAKHLKASASLSIVPDTKRLHTHYFPACQSSPGREIRTHANLDGKKNKTRFCKEASHAGAGERCTPRTPGLILAGSPLPTTPSVWGASAPAPPYALLTDAPRQAARAPTARSPLAADSRAFKARLT